MSASQKPMPAKWFVVDQAFGTTYEIVGTVTVTSRAYIFEDEDGEAVAIFPIADTVVLRDDLYNEYWEIEEEAQP